MKLLHDRSQQFILKDETIVRIKPFVDPRFGLLYRLDIVKENHVILEILKPKTPHQIVETIKTLKIKLEKYREK